MQGDLTLIRNTKASRSTSSKVILELSYYPEYNIVLDFCVFLFLAVAYSILTVGKAENA